MQNRQNKTRRYGFPAFGCRANRQELDFGQFPARNGFPGIPVKAWIRFPNCAELVDGEVYAWTAKAAEVTWKDGPVTYRTWVWSSAVTRPRRNDEQEPGRTRTP